MFSTNPRESAVPVHPKCVVTPRTRRTLPSQNSTFVMSRGRSCDHGVDWAVRFYCLTTWLTFEPQQARVLGHTRKHQQKILATWALLKKERQQKSSAATTTAPFMSLENTDVRLPPKWRVHSTPKAVLSLIRAASSCLQQSPAHFIMAGQHTQISDLIFSTSFSLPFSFVFTWLDLHTTRQDQNHSHIHLEFLYTTYIV